MKNRIYSLVVIFFCFILTSCGPSDPELHIYMWADYVKPSLIKQFEQEHHCRITIDTFEGNEVMYAKIQAGAGGYDLITPSNYFVSLLQEQGLLQALDISLLPNLKYLDPDFLKQVNITSFDYSVPYMAAYTGIGYRKGKIKNLLPTWMMFSRADLHGRMTMLNDVRQVLGASLKQLGYSVNTSNEQEIKEASDLVIQWKKNLAKFESEQYKNGIATAEFLLVQGYSGDILQVMRDDENVDFLLPDEGVMIGYDAFVISKDSQQVELAHAFINFLQQPEVAAENTTFVLFLCPNSASYPLLSEKLRNQPGLFPPAEILEKSELVKDIGENIRLYYKAWDYIKEAD